VELFEQVGNGDAIDGDTFLRLDEAFEFKGIEFGIGKIEGEVDGIMGFELVLGISVEFVGVAVATDFGVRVDEVEEVEPDAVIMEGGGIDSVGTGFPGITEAVTGMGSGTEHPATGTEFGIDGLDIVDIHARDFLDGVIEVEDGEDVAIDSHDFLWCHKLV
jgi:hypothetical protein